MGNEIKLGDPVAIDVSGEIGQAIARAETLGGRVQYLVRYCNAMGVAVEQWWDDEALRKYDLDI